jgi:hypothetical protein
MNVPVKTKISTAKPKKTYTSVVRSRANSNSENVMPVVRMGQMNINSMDDPWMEGGVTKRK